MVYAKRRAFCLDLNVLTSCQVNVMPADAMAHCIARLSAAMIPTTCNKYFMVIIWNQRCR